MCKSNKCLACTNEILNRVQENAFEICSSLAVCFLCLAIIAYLCNRMFLNPEKIKTQLKKKKNL